MKENQNFTPVSTAIQENGIISGGHSYQETFGEYT